MAGDKIEEKSFESTNYHDKWLEEKFIGLNKFLDLQFRDIHGRLDIIEPTVKSIEKQAILTNSRVNHLEEGMEAAKDQAEIAANLAVEVKNDLSKHPLECPTAKQIVKIENDLLEYRFFIKYPKLTVSILGVCVILFVMGSNIWNG